MKNLTNILIGLTILAFLCPISCTRKPSKVEQLRLEKRQKDSLNLVHARQTLVYSDSLLQILLPQTDPLLKTFRYEKNDKVEDHGHYVHKLLQTGSNTSRNFLQAYVSDNRRTTVQSYYFGSRGIGHTAVRLSCDGVFVHKEGSCHSFEAEGIHEITSIQGDDAIELLQFIANNKDKRILVSAEGKQSAKYYLNDKEKQALTDTYQLAVLMNDIFKLEQAIHVSQLQIQKLQKRLDL